MGEIIRPFGVERPNDASPYGSRTQPAVSRHYSASSGSNVIPWGYLLPGPQLLALSTPGLAAAGNAERRLLKASVRPRWSTRCKD